jgi:hypothetical protein
MNTLNEDGYIIIEDIIEKNNQDFLENFLMSNNFEWYFYPSTSTDHTFKNITNCYEGPQFVHIFFDGLKEEKDKHNSPHLIKILTILSGLYNKIKLQNYKLLRVKSNLLMARSQNTYDNFTLPHVDTSKKHLVLIYYVNDNDGKTFLFNKDLSIKTTIIPKKGSALLFDGSILHASSHPIKYQFRTIVNFDLEFENN